MSNTHIGFKTIYVVGGMWSLYFNYITLVQREKQLELLNKINNKIK